ncbi:hypothetical protein [Polaribacter sp. SA4-12]|uniref:hypothetical protein n=1 Tax=Polaribacter sp. SA4-12 TaxID=1312072 RepID=UPI000B3C3C9E|nr:hypothetical protein [Polaribacter sp. SA4-12]ARV16235.1 hypothetical protein BTO07_14260 [Polaribacter sp. SA4-12]
MKNFNLFALLASFTLILSSCSTNDTLLPEEQSLDLLKTYTIIRDVDGAYSLDYSLNGNAETENVIDNNTNTNNIYLYSSDSQSSRRVTQDLTIDGTQITVGFVDTNSNNSPEITIIDDNVTTLAKTSDNKMLNEYSISSSEDGTYNLDFSVNNKVRVDFVFNEEIDTYEIHLEEGKTGEKNFSRVLEKEYGLPLKFTFVNHINGTNSRSDVFTTIKKPAVIIL